MTSIQFVFESTSSHGWVGPLHNSHRVNGAIATQNAGSISNKSLYYQVGGKGMNGRFATELGRANQLDDANGMLIDAYNGLYPKADDGSLAWDHDSSQSPPRSDRLTSFIVGLIPDGRYVGGDIAAMAYSVGPVLGPAGIVDDQQYQSIYFDAVCGIDAWNDDAKSDSSIRTISGLRIVMLSCGIYAQSVTDRTKLYEDSARNIILGAAKALKAYPSLDGLTILINTNDATSMGGKPHVPKERPAFTSAATGLGLTVTSTGFTVTPAQAPG